MDAPSLQPSARNGSVVRAILIGGLTVGVSDFVFALVYYRAPWQAIARSVAGGVLGREDAAAAGEWVLALGVGLHFIVALGAAAVFVLASRKFPILVRHPGPAGLVYGVVVYFVMNWVVLPASALVLPRYPPPIDWGALVGHMVLVGLPIALVTRWVAPVGEAAVRGKVPPQS